MSAQMWDLGRGKELATLRLRGCAHARSPASSVDSDTAREMAQSAPLGASGTDCLRSFPGPRA
eukprot:7026056-Alexandrium_andersonii.AAC.1